MAGIETYEHTKRFYVIETENFSHIFQKLQYTLFKILKTKFSVANLETTLPFSQFFQNIVCITL